MTAKAAAARKGDLHVEQWAIGKVLPYANNAKVHPDLQVGRLAESMRQFGFVNPCLVDAKGELIAGHGRILAAKSLGMKRVPVIQLGHLSEAQVRALRLADNSIAEGGSWNPDLLKVELIALKDASFDLSPLGLDDIALPELPGHFTDAEPKAPRSKSTIFVSVQNTAAERARKLIVAALDKAGITHNL